MGAWTLCHTGVDNSGSGQLITPEPFSGVGLALWRGEGGLGMKAGGWESGAVRRHPLLHAKGCRPLEEDVCVSGRRHSVKRPQGGVSALVASGSHQPQAGQDMSGEGQGLPPSPTPSFSGTSPKPLLEPSPWCPWQGDSDV